MSSPNAPELKLKLADNIAKTLINYIDFDKNSADAENEARISAEDIATSILEDLNLSLRDGVDDDGFMVATMFAIPPEMD